MSTVTKLDEMTSKLPQEFGRIFEDHYDLIYRTAYGITRTVEDAEDVVQMIFLQLIQRELPVDLIRSPKAYFYRAAVNLSLRTIRSRQREILTSNSRDFETSTAAVRSSRNEIPEKLEQAIAELNERAAQILILHYVHDYSLVEIASLLETTRGTVAVSLFRSRARLKKLIRAAQ